MALRVCAPLHAFVSRWPNDMGSRCRAPYDRFFWFRDAPTAGYSGVEKHRRQRHLILRAVEHLMHSRGRHVAVIKGKEVITKKKNCCASNRTYLTTERVRAPSALEQTKRAL